MAKTCANGCPYPVFSKRLCKSCWGKEYGKPLARSSYRPDTDKKSKPVKQVSDKQKVRNALYAKARTAFMLSKDECEAKFAPNCSGLPEQVHHKEGRSGDMLLATEYWIAVCANCHEAIHRNDAEARKKGLLLRRIT